MLIQIVRILLNVYMIAPSDTSIKCETSRKFFDMSKIWRETVCIGFTEFLFFVVMEPCAIIRIRKRHRKGLNTFRNFLFIEVLASIQNFVWA